MTGFRKVILVGDERSGKSSMIKSLKKQFSENYIKTNQIEKHRLVFDFIDGGNTFTIDIFDIPNTAVEHQDLANDIAGAGCAIICVAPDKDCDAFGSIVKWNSFVKNINENICVMICQTQTDLVNINPNKESILSVDDQLHVK